MGLTSHVQPTLAELLFTYPKWIELTTRNELPRPLEDKTQVETGEFMGRLRVLLLGPDCNPDQVSIPLVTYYHAAALAQLHDVTLVARSSVEDALRRANAPFRAIEVIGRQGSTASLSGVFAGSSNPTMTVRR